MADKITNFEDYRKRDVKPNTGDEPEPKERPSRPSQPVSQETMEIHIEDPFQFLNEEEREEYIRQRQMSDAPEQHRAEEQRPERRPEPEPEPERRARRPEPRREEPAYNEDYPEEEYDEEYDEGYDEEGEEAEGGVNMELVVRIASIITGVVILFFVGMFLKAKVFDRFLAPDPDEAQTVVAAIPAGYTEKNDTVVVSGASSLNLRTVPSTGSDDTIDCQAPEGTELKRIAVSSDGSWALVEYQGKQLYASTKYLKEK